MIAGRRRCRALMGFLSGLFVLVLAVPVLASSAESLQPTQWPATASLSPRVEGWPNALRISGTNRYGTSLAASLFLRGAGNFPYGTPDPASEWWGLKTCPRAVIIVAGDSPADALSATSLSDPAGLARKPYLQRVAAGDPLFDPIGGFKRVDTDYAPIILTEAARNRANQLTLSSRYALQDLRAGGCKSAREAIIVGGYNAVSKDIESELVSIGYDSVYRVAGANRFSTASAVARAMGTSLSNANDDECEDMSVDDGPAHIAFYSNSVVEYRESPNQCELLSRTAVLTDGVTGADAVAAGWWTSFWQVPVILHDGSRKLPAETAAVLQTLQISNLIVLGGTARIPETVVDEAKNLADANIVRIGGEDRYETSVLMARHFGGWWPSTPSASADGSMLCIAASSGTGFSARGWPDALGAGPVCANATANGAGAPDRLLLPYNGQEPGLTDSVKIPGRRSVPIILVPYNSQDLPNSVEAFLRESFVSDYRWCSSATFSESCFRPGFALVFGGNKSVSTQNIDLISGALAGLKGSGGEASIPEMNSVFVTELALNPIYGDVGDGMTKICFPRSSYSSARWLVAGTSKSSAPVVTFDAAMARWYLSDSEGPSRSPGYGRPACIKVAAGAEESVWAQAVGLDGHATAKTEINRSEASKFALNGDLKAVGPTQLAGEPTYSEAKSGKTSVTFAERGDTGVSATMQGETTEIRDHSITISIQRGELYNQNVDLFEGSWQIKTVHGTVIGQVSGEARQSNNIWYLDGRSEVTGGSWSNLLGTGGFSATIDIKTISDTDDELNWQVDGRLTLP